jgi:hypothetical protein
MSAFAVPDRVSWDEGRPSRTCPVGDYRRICRLTRVQRRDRRRSTRSARGPLMASSTSSNVTRLPTARSWNDVPSHRSLRWKNTFRSLERRMKPCPCPSMSVTMRPEFGVPRRSAGRTTAALRPGTALRLSVVREMSDIQLPTHSSVALAISPNTGLDAGGCLVARLNFRRSESGDSIRLRPAQYAATREQHTTTASGRSHSIDDRRAGRPAGAVRSSASSGVDCQHRSERRKCETVSRE